MNITRIAVLILATALSGTATAQTYSIGSNPQGSLAYATAAGVAKVASEDIGLKARVVPQGGPIVNLPLLNDGELDFNISTSIVTAFANKGLAMFKGRPQKNLRVVASLFPMRLSFYVRSDSDIKSLKDLKGKRLATKFTKQKIAWRFGRAKLAMVGLTYKDVTGVPVPNGVRQVDDFIAGKIDAATWSLSSGKTRQAHAAVGGIRVLPLPTKPQAVAAMQKITPGAIIETIHPSPKFPGIKGPTNILAVPFLLVSSARTPDEVVYKIVKGLYSAKKKLVGVHKAFGDFAGDKMHLDVGLPYHRGSLKFFKEKGF